MSTVRFAICMFDDHIKKIDAKELLVGEGLVPAEFTEESEFELRIFQRKSEPSTPAWVNILSGFTAISDSEIKTSTAGAILFLRIEERILACCFGTSVGNIDRNNIVSDFGLGVVFTQMPPNQTKSVETFSLAHNPITNDRNAAIPTDRGSFDIDTYLENITELSGYFYRAGNKTLIKGKEFYSSPVPDTFDGIVSICKKAIGDYDTATGNETFQRLTSTNKVKDKATKAALDEEMLKELNKRTKDIFLIDFESLEEIAGYRLTPKGNPIAELSIDELYQATDPSKVFTTDTLKTKEIYPIDSSGDIIARWSLYRCLFWEVEFGGEVFIIYKGKWYKIAKDYLASLKTYIAEFEQPLTGVTPWDGKKSEGEFNDEMARELGGQCWDKILYTTDSYRYGIEFCDVLTDSDIFHVKKLKGSSLTSHLLMQTSVSAILLKNDLGIRDWIREKTSKTPGWKHLLVNRARKFTNPPPRYFILLMSTKTGTLVDNLPFFSMVTIHMTIRRILQLGFEVKIGKI